METLAGLGMAVSTGVIVFILTKAHYSNPPKKKEVEKNSKPFHRKPKKA